MFFIRLAKPISNAMLKSYMSYAKVIIKKAYVTARCVFEVRRLLITSYFTIKYTHKYDFKILALYFLKICFFS